MGFQWVLITSTIQHVTMSQELPMVCGIPYIPQVQKSPIEHNGFWISLKAQTNSFLRKAMFTHSKLNLKMQMIEGSEDPSLSSKLKYICYRHPQAQGSRFLWSNTWCRFLWQNFSTANEQYKFGIVEHFIEACWNSSSSWSCLLDHTCPMENVNRWAPPNLERMK